MRRRHPASGQRAQTSILRRHDLLAPLDAQPLGWAHASFVYDGVDVDNDAAPSAGHNTGTLILTAAVCAAAGVAIGVWCAGPACNAAPVRRVPSRRRRSSPTLPPPHSAPRSVAAPVSVLPPATAPFGGATDPFAWRFVGVADDLDDDGPEVDEPCPAWPGASSEMIKAAVQSMLACGGLARLTSEPHVRAPVGRPRPMPPRPGAVKTAVIAPTPGEPLFDSTNELVVDPAEADVNSDGLHAHRGSGPDRPARRRGRKPHAVRAKIHDELVAAAAGGATAKELRALGKKRAKAAGVEYDEGCRRSIHREVVGITGVKQERQASRTRGARRMPT